MSPKTNWRIFDLFLTMIMLFVVTQNASWGTVIVVFCWGMWNYTDGKFCLTNWRLHSKSKQS